MDKNESQSPSKSRGGQLGNHNASKAPTLKLNNYIQAPLKNAMVKASQPRKPTAWLEEAILEKLQRERPDLVDKFGL